MSHMPSYMSVYIIFDSSESVIKLTCTVSPSVHLYITFKQKEPCLAFAMSLQLFSCSL